MCQMAFEVPNGRASMEACQVVRAVDLAIKGVLVAPRKLLEYLVNEEFVDTGSLPMRQREILTHVADGLTNAQIAERLNLSEFTIKQHLRHAYKVLRVKNRIEAADLFRNET